MPFFPSSGGVEVAAFDLGGEGPPLLFAHATGFHGLVWRPMADELEPSFQTFSFDERGHGDSPTPPDGDFSWWSFANDAVAVTSGPESGSVAELPNTTASSTPDTTNGTLAFSDVDLSDVHSVSIALDSAVWSASPDGGPPFQTSIDLQTALNTTLHDSIGSGSGGVDWTFSIPDSDLDF